MGQALCCKFCSGLSRCRGTVCAGLLQRARCWAGVA